MRKERKKERKKPPEGGQREGEEKEGEKNQVGKEMLELHLITEVSMAGMSKSDFFGGGGAHLAVPEAN